MSDFLNLTNELSTAVDQLNQILQGDDSTTVVINGRLQPSVQKKTLEEVVARVQIVLDAAADIDAVKYSTVAIGLANTANGQFFSVVSTNDDNYLDLYKNESGSALFKKSYPSTSGVLNNRLVDSVTAEQFKFNLSLADGELLFNYEEINQ